MVGILCMCLSFQIQFVTPDRYQVTHGVEIQGGIQRVRFSDDDRLIVEARRPFTVAEPSVEVIFEATSPTETPQDLGVEVEAMCTGSPAIQRIEYFNFTTQTWEVVDERNAPDFDQVISTHGQAPAPDYVEDGTRKMRIKVGYHDRGVTFLSWSGQYDRILWGVVP